MRKTKRLEIFHTIHHTKKKKAANLRFVPEITFSRGNSTGFDKFPSSPNCRILNLARRHRVLQNPSVRQSGAVGGKVTAVFFFLKISP
jgi:hypothetical protein